MNTDSKNCKPSKCLAVVGIIGSFLVMGWMVWLMRGYTHTESLFEVRGDERIKVKKAFDEANTPLTTTYDWQDKTRGFVRVPVDEAKELILQEWQDPAKGKKLLSDRAKKAFAPVSYE